ncbi:Abi family protein [Streptomyces sp. AgN23]|nr:Abi family protein [Streptomyces sp. AgN23]
MASRDIDRSKDRHILRYRDTEGDRVDYSKLPVWSAVEAWSFGTLSKAIERGAGGALADAVATSVGVAKAGFAYRVRPLVYLRNRCPHHSRLWHHSVLDAGPTPNNVRNKAKRLAGQFESRSVLDASAPGHWRPGRRTLVNSHREPTHANGEMAGQSSGWGSAAGRDRAAGIPVQRVNSPASLTRGRPRQGPRHVSRRVQWDTAGRIDE